MLEHMTKYYRHVCALCILSCMESLRSILPKIGGKYLFGEIVGQGVILLYVPTKSRMVGRYDQWECSEEEQELSFLWKYMTLFPPICSTVHGKTRCCLLAAVLGLFLTIRVNSFFHWIL